MNRDMGAYINFLNGNDRSVFHRSQPATRADPFWPNAQQTTGDISDILWEDSLDAEMSGLDAYDPTFEDDLNSIADSSLSGEEEDFWFTTDGQTSTTNESTSKADLLNLIKERELAQ